MADGDPCSTIYPDHMVPHFGAKSFWPDLVVGDQAVSAREARFGRVAEIDS